MKRLINIPLFLVMLTSAGCPKTPQQSNIQLSTDAGAPGETVILKYSFPGNVNASDFTVLFGKEPALIISANKDSTLEILIPKVAEGKTQLSVKSKEVVLGETEFSIEPTNAQKLLLEYSNGKYALLRKDDVMFDNSIDNIASDHMMLFDVTNGAGEIIGSGAFENPGYIAHEIFEKPEQIHRENPMKNEPQTFSITIPNGKENYTVKFYEIEQYSPGLHYSQLLQDEKILRTKKEVGQLVIEN